MWKKENIYLKQNWSSYWKSWALSILLPEKSIMHPMFEWEFKVTAHQSKQNCLTENPGQNLKCISLLYKWVIYYNIPVVLTNKDLKY